MNGAGMAHSSNPLSPSDDMVNQFKQAASATVTPVRKFGRRRSLLLLLIIIAKKLAFWSELHDIYMNAFAIM